MSSRLSRQEIKRDGVLETLGGAFEFLRRYGRTLLIGALVLLVAAIGAIVWVQVQGARSKRASEALAEAVRLFEAPIDGAADASDASDAGGAAGLPSFPDEAARTQRVETLLGEVRDSFGGTDSAHVATVYLADLAAERGDLEQARALWQEFLETQSGHILAVQVRVSRMAADRALGRGEEVLAELEAMADVEDSELPQPLVLHELATTLEALGRSGEARDAYLQLAEEYAASPYAADAQRKADEIGVNDGAG